MSNVRDGLNEVARKVQIVYVLSKVFLNTVIFLKSCKRNCGLFKLLFIHIQINYC